jgi:hypothetical protein
MTPELTGQGFIKSPMDHIEAAGTGTLGPEKKDSC